MLESFVGSSVGDAGDVIAWSGVDDTGHNQTRDRPAKLDLSIQSDNVIFHSDMNSETVTTQKALHSVWVRVHGVGSKMSAMEQTFYEENRVTHEIKSLQTWLNRQGPRDMQLHHTFPYKLDALPDDYCNGTTQIKSHSHSALTALTAKGKLLATTSKPGGQDKTFVTKLFENVNDPGTVKATDLYVKVLEFVVTVDEHAKFGATTQQKESCGLFLSCMMREEVNPRGKPSTAPDMLVVAETFIPNQWPTIIPPTASSANVGEIRLTSPLRLGQTSILGGRLGHNLTLNEGYIYTTHASNFGIAVEGGVLNPRYAFVKDGHVFFALTEHDAACERGVSVPGAVIPHNTNFRPMVPKKGAYGRVREEHGINPLIFGRVAHLVN